MKYKIYSIVLMGCMLFMSFVISAKPIDYRRVNEHLETPKKEPCNHEDTVFCTHLPVISIDTENNFMPEAIIEDPLTGKESFNNEVVGAMVTVYDSYEKNNHLNDEPMYTSKGNVRYRGNSSRKFDKKGILINLIKEDGKKNKLPILGMTKDSSWILHGPYLDKTLMRNYMWYNIAGEIMEYSPNVRFCEVFLNNEHMGIYVLTEKIDFNEEGRVNVTKAYSNRSTTSYILEIDRGYAHEDKIIKTFSSYALKMPGEMGKGGVMEIVYPGSKTLTEGHKEYITEDISNFEKALYSFDYKDKKYGYENFINVQSFIDYFIINEFTTNYDSLFLSTYLYKDIRGKMNMVVWDFNSSCDNYALSQTNPQRFEMQENFWYKMLFKDERFVERVIRRYRYLRKNVLSDEYLLNYIDEVALYLGDAIYRNYEKWGYTFQEEYDELHPTERNPRTYEDAINQMKEFIISRGKFMDENIETLYQYCHSSQNKKFNHEVE